MAYEIEFIGVSSDKCGKDADAICLRWKKDTDNTGTSKYTIGVIDGGFEPHGEAMVNHINKYYFVDESGKINSEKKEIDFVVVTHPDQDHTMGVKKILENFKVKRIYMNRPWLYADDLFNKVDDGRMTVNSLKKCLREKYSTIADIEKIAEDKEIPIYDAFQGTYIESSLLILSPCKQFYLDLLVESEKTPLHEEETQKNGLIKRFTNSVKEYILKALDEWDIETLREDVKTTSENESSVVIRGIIEGEGFLMTGDAGIRALTNAMDYMDSCGENIKKIVSFYQIPHHGARHNVSSSLLDRMIGEIVNQDDEKNKTAFASVAEDSDHPLKMVTNAYIRRGVKTYKTDGNTIRHHVGDMPERNWSSLSKIEFSKYVEEWED